MLILFTRNVMGLLICGNSLSWILNLNLTSRHWIGVGNGLLILILEKLNVFYFIVEITLVLLMSKCFALSYMKNHQDAGISSLLSWIGVLTLSSLLKVPARTLKVLIRSMKFLRMSCFISINLLSYLAWNTVVTSWRGECS